MVHGVTIRRGLFGCDDYLLLWWMLEVKWADIRQNGSIFQACVLKEQQLVGFKCLFVACVTIASKCSFSKVFHHWS